MREYFLIYDIEEFENFQIPNFTSCVRVDNGFKRIDDLEQFILTGEGLAEEIINPRRKGYFLITKQWKKDLDDTLKRYEIL